MNPTHDLRDAPLILASSSRWRRQLLMQLQLDFQCVSPDIDETPRAGEAPDALARRLAHGKAARVQADHPDALVLGSDQVATADDRTPIGKPGSFERAREQLRAASGRTLRFHTAWALLGPDGFVRDGLQTVQVRYRELDDETIDTYLRAEQPFDCAGSARCEGLGIALLRSIDSDDPTTLIGLPLISVTAALRGAGIDPVLRLRTADGVAAVARPDPARR